MTMANALMMTAADVQPVAETRLLGSIAVGRGPIADIAVDGAKIITTNSGDASVSVLDVRTLRPEASVAVDGEPFAVTKAGSRAFVASSAATYDAVSAIDTRTNSFLASLPMDFDVVSVAAGPDGRRLFVSGTGADNAVVAIVDVESGGVTTVAVADQESIVGAVRVTANGRFAFVATSDPYRGTLTAIDTAQARIVAVLPTVAPIQDFVLSDDASVAYVLGRDPEHGGFVDTVDTRSKQVLTTAWLGGHPTQFALGLDGNRIYIVDVDRIAVLCTITNEFVDALLVDAQPSCVAVSADGSRLYVADYSGGVTAFSVPSASFGDVIDAETIALARELQPAGV